MALQYTRLADIQTIGATLASVYANPASTKTYIRGFSLDNTHASSVTVALHLVPDVAAAVGTAALTNRVYTFLLPANEGVIVDLPASGWVLLDTNDTVQASATVADKVTLVLFGDKE